MSRAFARSVCVSLSLLVFASAAHAQWALNGAPVATATGQEAEACSVADGSGGVIVAWVDDRLSLNKDIYVQKLNAQGVPQWTTDGVLICGATDNQFRLDICSDGAGGAIMAWSDYRNNTNFADIYVQRVNAAGAPVWTANGVQMVSDPQDQFEPKICADGSGGAIVCWTDPRAGNYDIYARKINSAGVPQWAANGVALCTQATDQRFPRIVSDNAGGAFVAWRDDRAGVGNRDIYARRVDSAGTPQAAANGVAICAATGNQDNHQLIADGSGGMIITWEDPRAGQTDIYAQKLNSASTAQWLANGYPICADLSNQTVPVLTTDGAGGAIIAWQDARATVSDIYARRMLANGQTSWSNNGVQICGAAQTQLTPVILSDGVGGAFIAWADVRSTTSGDVYIRRVTGLGAAMWTTDGVPLCVGEGSVFTLSIVSNGSGGGTVVWSDSRTGLNDLFAQRFDGVYGYWGYPEPVVTAVSDIRYDQGGKVKVNWTASGRDRSEPRTIGSYSIWRAVDVSPSSPLAAGITDVAHTDTKKAGPVFASAAGMYWELVATQKAYGFSAYSIAADTRADSVLANPGNTSFMVSAHVGTDEYIAFQSNTVIGHSVDNLAPVPPLALIAQRVGNYVYLKWNGVHLPDMKNYAVYRKTSTGVMLILGNFLSTSPDTLYTDSSAPASALYYIVTAKDVHANESNASNEAAVAAATGVGNTPAITQLSVLQNRPNPFTAGTEFQIGLPSASRVDIRVYDVAGRRVREMTLHNVPAGWKNVAFDARDDSGRALASGVYFYKVSAAGKTITTKMVIAR